MECCRRSHQLLGSFPSVQRWGQIQGFWEGGTPACVPTLPREACVDSLMPHMVMSPDPAALGEDGMGMVWVPWGTVGSCLLARVPAQGAGEQAPLQADSGASPLPCPLPCGCTKAGHSTPCPP